MATLKNQFAEIEFKLGAKEYECEVRFNYTPESKGSQFEPPEDEEFEIFSVSVVIYSNGNYIYSKFSDDMIDLLNDEIIAKIKEQKED